MTTKEIRERIAESGTQEWFDSLVLDIKFPNINLAIKLTGATSANEFFETQVDGWSKRGANIPEELQRSKTAFQDTLKQIAQAMDSQYDHQPRHIWNEINTRFLPMHQRYYFRYDCPETEFLIKTNRDFPASFQSAYNFINNNINNTFSDKNNLIGTLLAYEFSLKDSSQILERRSSETESFSSLRNTFQNYLSKTEVEITSYLEQTNEKYNEYVAKINKFKNSKEQLFEKWFKETQDSFNNLKMHLLLLCQN